MDTRTGDPLLTVRAPVLGQTRRHGAVRAKTSLDHRCALGRGVVVDPPGQDAAAGAVEPIHQTTPTDRPLQGDDTVVASAHHRDQPQGTPDEEANGTEAAHPFVSVVGAAWLLMGQPGATETRAIADTPTPRPPAAGVAGPDIAPTPRGTITELRRPVRLPHD